MLWQKNLFYRYVSLLTPLTCFDCNRTTMKRRYEAATSRKPRFKTATRVSRQTQIGAAKGVGPLDATLYVKKIQKDWAAGLDAGCVTEI